MPDTIDNIIVPEGTPTGRRAFMPDAGRQSAGGLW